MLSCSSQARRARRRPRGCGAVPRKTRGKEPKDTEIKSLDELVDFFLTAGKRGIAINRYKGLAR